ncbi:MAG: hypothetical protein GWN84_17180 [Gammaproteobacteria bacterium]|nr:hypothetical protein [Gammaproteobacteria bacterium]NIR84571.1 hypothetical protein [Gammaproteobacteria bacterium]NIR90474.1 hypothetical protein [Gammaproteobacteria bacterium]NIU05622.1 hypothetical protein [Gammaproteobacteria bacterium]NIV52761.1 hypothetical protein [Gammaproteobacteria bacterium]
MAKTPTHSEIERFAAEMGLFEAPARIDDVVGEVKRKAAEEGRDLSDDEVIADLTPRLTERLAHKGLLDTLDRLVERMKAEGYDFTLDPGPMCVGRH